MTARDRGVLAASGVALVVAAAAMGALDSPHRRIAAFLAVYAVAFGAYVVALRTVLRANPSGRAALWGMFVVAIAARAAVLPARPDLSTDIYRYLWEGRAILHGANPFVTAPSDTTLAAMRDETYDRVNHKSLPTIYPPLAQGLFAAAAWIRPNVATLKIIFTVFDVATIALLVLLLRSRGRPPTHALVYAWSPLVIVETAHSGHVDAAGVFLLALGLVLWQRGRRVGAGIAFGASLLVKYLAAALAPLFVRRGAVRALVAMGVTAALGYAWFFDAGPHLLGSLRVYGDTWWFNGPPFIALAGFLGDATVARRLLAGFGIAFVLVTARREHDPVRYLYLVTGCALLVSPTVYPWYLVWMVPLLCIYPNQAWIAFTGLVALSYAVWVEYDRSGAWRIPTWLLAAEYVPFYTFLAYGLWSQGTRRA
jgi:alpha-1,6-mannosyltransferase